MLAIHFLAHWLWTRRVPLLPRFLYQINRALFAVVLPPSVAVGKRVQFSYSGLGTVVHARAVIGNGVSIGAGVVIGGRSGASEVPIIEDDVEIGVGAKILGAIRIGRGSVIGANAVVIKDVPAGSVAVGVPARIISKQ